ncbi:uncharacterized protein LOC124695890 [Lolium rigidum]|uniref:uncharacterized protein LOC124695890 n=1 Tax=Lolium rigidum TaxID=89674 RepID=UPI001F5CAC3A|nr:uncharacterized protein LOC124695890 [Lolium rigidum]
MAIGGMTSSPLLSASDPARVATSTSPRERTRSSRTAATIWGETGGHQLTNIFNLLRSWPDSGRRMALAQHKMPPWRVLCWLEQFLRRVQFWPLQHVQGHRRATCFPIH